MIGHYIPKSIMKVLNILPSFPPPLCLLFRVNCWQPNLHSCKEDNCSFANLFLGINVKADIYPRSILCDGNIVLGFANTEDFSVYLCSLLNWWLLKDVYFIFRLRRITKLQQTGQRKKGSVFLCSDSGWP